MPIIFRTDKELSNARRRSCDFLPRRTRSRKPMSLEKRAELEKRFEAERRANDARLAKYFAK